MQLTVRGTASGAVADAPHNIAVSVDGPMGPALQQVFGRNLQGKELWATMPDGRIQRIGLQDRPADYGLSDADIWSLFLRSAPIPECPMRSIAVSGDAVLSDCTNTGSGSKGGLLRMSWSRDPCATAACAKRAKKPDLRAKGALSPPKKVHSRRLASAPTAEQAQRALFNYNYVVNDALISKDLARSVLSEVVKIHFNGSLSQSKGGLQQEAPGGAACWVSGESHQAIRRWARLVDAAVSGLTDVGVSGRSAPLISCYAPGARGETHFDNAHDPRRKLTATMFLLQQNVGKGGEGGDFRMVTATNEVIAAPLLGRLLLHWSDERCCHEVLPTASATLYTITLWYYACGDETAATSTPTPLPRTLPSPAAAPVAAVHEEAAKKKKKKRRKKSGERAAAAHVEHTLADPNGADYRTDSSEDNWMVFCCSLRAALAAALALGVLHVRLPAPAPEAGEEAEEQRGAPLAPAAPLPAVARSPQAAPAAEPPAPAAEHPPAAAAEVAGLLEALDATQAEAQVEGLRMRRALGQMAAHQAEVDWLQAEHKLRVAEAVREAFAR